MTNIVNFSADAGDLVRQIDAAITKVNEWNKTASKVLPMSGGPDKVMGFDKISESTKSMKNAAGEVEKYIVRTYKAYTQTGQQIVLTQRKLASDITDNWEEVNVEITNDLAKHEKKRLDLSRQDYAARRRMSKDREREEKDAAKKQADLDRLNYESRKRWNAQKDKDDAESKKKKEREDKEALSKQEGLNKLNYSSRKRWNAQKDKDQEAQNKKDEKAYKEATDKQASLDRLNYSARKKLRAAERREIEEHNRALLKTQTTAGQNAATDKRYRGATNLSSSLVGQLLPNGLEGATKQTLASITMIRKNIEQLLTTGKITKTELNNLFNRIKAGEKDFVNLSRGERLAEIELRKLVRVTQEFNSLGKRTQDVLLSWRGVLRLFAVQQLHLAISVLTRDLTQAADRAIQFSKTIGTIQTISEKNAGSIELWSKNLIELSNNFDIELLDATEAAYEALSNQIGRNIDVIYFLDDAFNLAQATTSKALDTTNLLSGALKGYNLQQLESQRISNILFKTIDLGRVRVEQIADTFGNTTPMAKALGISFEELNAALQTLTVKGVRPDTALTSINNIILTLLKPSESFKDLLKEWGVNSGEAAIQSFGFVGVLEKLEAELQSGGLERIADIAKNMRAIRAEAGLLAGGTFDDFSKNLQETTEDVDALNKASAIMAENVGVKVDKAFKQYKNTMTSILGQGAIKLLAQAYDDLGQSTEDDLKPLLETLVNIGAITKDIIVNGTLLVKNIGTVNGLFSEQDNIIGQLIPTIGFMIASTKISNALNTLQIAHFTALETKQKTSATLWQTLIGKLNAFKQPANIAAEQTRNLAFSVNAAAYGIPLLVGAIVSLRLAYQNYQQDLSNINDEITNKLLEANRDRLDALEKSLAKEVDLTAKSVQEKLREFNKLLTFINLAQKTDPIDLKLFNLALENNAKDIDNIIPKLNKLTENLNKVGEAARKEMAGGHFDNAEKLFDKLVDSARDINSEISSVLGKIKDTVKTLGGDKEESLLETKLFGKNSRQQLKIINEEIAKMANELNQLEAAGDIEKALEKADKLRSLIDKSQGLGVKGKIQPNAQLEIDIIDKQIKLNEDLAKLVDARKVDEFKLLEQEVKGFEAVKNSANQTEEAIRKVNIQIEEVSTNLAKLSQEQLNVARDLAGGLANLGGFVGQTSDLFRLDGFFASDITKLRGDAAAKMFFETEGGSYKDISDKLFKEQAIVNRDLAKASEEYNLTIQDNKPLEEQIAKREELNKALASAVSFYEKLKKISGVEDIRFGANNESFNLLISKIDQENQTINDTINRRQQVAKELLDTKQFQIQLQQTHEVLIQELKNYLQRWPDLYKQFSEAAQQPIRDLNAILEEFKNNLNTIRNGVIEAGQPPGKALGGVLGRDNQIFRGHSGEMIMQEQAVARNYKTLSAINSGFSIDNSSSVINVGDVNVNMNVPRGTNVDGQMVGKAVRNALRRGIVRLS